MGAVESRNTQKQFSFFPVWYAKLKHATMNTTKMSAWLTSSYGRGNWLATEWSSSSDDMNT